MASSVDLLPWRRLDWLLVGLVLLITSLGMATIWGTTHHVPRLAGYPARQVAWWAVGVLAMLTTLVVDVRVYRRLAPLAYIGTVGLLVYLLVQPVRIKGATSWLLLPGGMRFQPSEFAKIATIAMVAAMLADRRPSSLSATERWKLMFKLGAVVAVPFCLIFVQPDLGTAIVLLPVLWCIMLAAGFSRRFLMGLVLAGMLAGVAAYPFLRPYQQARLTIHLQPESDPRGRGYNIIQAKIAIGSGGLWGKGLGQGTQSGYQFLPEHHTDFIFNSLGEQLGLVGCALLVAAYVIVIARCLSTAPLARDHYGAYLVVGLTAMFATHVAFNLLIAVQVLPVTGLPLPLMSVGGSFLVANYVLFGMILNVRARRYD